MTMPLKVWAGWIMRPLDAPPAPNGRGSQVHAIVQTTSKKKAAMLLAVSPGHVNNFMSETGNAVDLARAQPEQVIWCEMDEHWHPNPSWRRAIAIDGRLRDTGEAW